MARGMRRALVGHRGKPCREPLARATARPRRSILELRPALGGFPVPGSRRCRRARPDENPSAPPMGLPSGPWSACRRRSPGSRSRSVSQRCSVSGKRACELGDGQRGLVEEERRRPRGGGPRRRPGGSRTGSPPRGSVAAARAGCSSRSIRRGIELAQCAADPEDPVVDQERDLLGQAAPRS